MDGLTERIEIINSFNILDGSRNKTIAYLKRKSSILFYIYLLLAIVFVSIVLWSITIELTGFHSKFNWSRASVSVLFSISTLFNVLKGIYSDILLKHLYFLKNSTTKKFDENLNTELAEIITINNKPLGANVFIVSLAIIILIGAVTNFLMDNQFIYYKFFIAPTLLFYILTIIEGVKTYKKLKANIGNIENH